MPDSQTYLENIDRLIADLGGALAERDWEAISKLNAQVKPAVEPLLAALEAGDLEAEPVRLRLQELQQFIDAADESARTARKEAEDGLKGVNRNRSAAKAYQNVSSNRPK